MKKLHKFKCFLYDQVWPHDSKESERSWYLNRILVETNIAHSEEVNLSYESMVGKENIVYLTYLSGIMPKMVKGIEYEVEAVIEYKANVQKYGYRVVNISYAMPESLEEQEKFLRTTVTKLQAENILKVYPDFVRKVINNEHVSHKKIFNVGPVIMERITTKIRAVNALSIIYNMLKPFNISQKQIKMLIEKTNGPVQLVKKIEANPYVLTKLKGIGFKPVDEIISVVFPDVKLTTTRVISFIKDFLAKIAYQDGHTLVDIDSIRNGIKTDKGIEYVGINTLIPNSGQVLDDVLHNEQNNSLFSENFLYFHNNSTGLYYHYQIEKGIIDKIKSLNEADPIIVKHKFEAIESTEKFLGFKFVEEQIKAIKGLEHNNVIAITGPAGTGKSQILRAITKIYFRYSIALSSLSAMAAKRMHEFTNMTSHTIHKLLGYNGRKFTYNRLNPLPYHLYAMDENSMNNTWITQHWLRAIPEGSKVILIGDTGQLSPIGPGSPFRDIINSGLIPVYTLVDIHRQAKESGIVMDANAITNGKNPFDEQPEYEKWIIHGVRKDMSYYFTNNKNEAQRVILMAYFKAIEKFSIEDVGIIVPRKKNALLSTYELNRIIQKRLRKKKPSIRFNQYEFVLGDKVIQRENDHKDKGVINGEIGYVVEIDKENNNIAVRFGGSKIVRYSIYDFDEIDLAYCLTVHVFQGNQLPCMIIGVDYSHYNLLSNELLYTAITRAQEKCLFIGNYSAFQKAIATRLNERKTILSTLIKQTNES